MGASKSGLGWGLRYVDVDVDVDVAKVAIEAVADAGKDPNSELSGVWLLIVLVVLTKASGAASSR